MAKLVQGIVIDAYNQPAYSSTEFRRKAEDNFANDQAAKCFTAVTE